MMKARTYPPELIRERIIRVKSELRRLQMELRLAEAEARDRERFEQAAARPQEATRA